jgi:hypothetical protein
MENISLHRLFTLLKKHNASDIIAHPRIHFWPDGWGSFQFDGTEILPPAGGWEGMIRDMHGFYVSFLPRKLLNIKLAVPTAHSSEAFNIHNFSSIIMKYY